jgi:hypothetical protein
MAEQVVSDLRAWSEIFATGGLSALAASLEADAAVTWAMLPSAAEAERCFARRGESPVFCFAGERVVVRDADLPCRVLIEALSADGAMTVSLDHDAGLAEATLAEELAWRLELGVSAAMLRPASIGEELALLSVLATVRDIVEGRTTARDGTRRIASYRFTVSRVPTIDPDIDQLIGVGVQVDDDDLEQGWQWRSQTDPAWTRQQEGEELERFARREALSACWSLLRRYQGARR